MKRSEMIQTSKRAFGLLNGKTPTSSQCFTVLYCYGVLEMGSGRTFSISYVNGARAEHRGSTREPARDIRHASDPAPEQRSTPARSSASPIAGTRQHRGCAAEFPRYRTGSA